MKRFLMLDLILVLCTIIVVGFMVGAKQVIADNTPYGKYIYTEDPSSYIELKPDGSCLVIARIYSPGGRKPTGEFDTRGGTYEIKGDIVTLKLISFKSSKPDISDFRLEGNALVTIQNKSINERGGIKFIKQDRVEDNATKNTRLLDAVKAGNISNMIAILEQGADINTRSNDGLYNTPLHVASEKGYTHIVKLLLNRGADINARNSNGTTPLIYASRESHVDTVKLLLDRGADVNAKCDWGSTAMSNAKGHSEIVEMLKKAGAKE